MYTTTESRRTCLPRLPRLLLAPVRIGGLLQRRTRWGPPVATSSSSAVVNGETSKAAHDWWKGPDSTLGAPETTTYQIDDCLVRNWLHSLVHVLSQFQQSPQTIPNLT